MQGLLASARQIPLAYLSCTALVLSLLSIYLALLTPSRLKLGDLPEGHSPVSVPVSVAVPEVTRRGKCKENSLLFNREEKTDGSAYAYVHTVDPGTDLREGLFGILAFQGALRRVNSKHAHIVALHEESDLGKEKAFLEMATSLGIQVHMCNESAVLYPWGLTQFEKVLLINSPRVALLENSDEIFSYRAPSAPPERWAPLASNIGAIFLIHPDESELSALTSKLAETRDWMGIPEELKEKVGLMEGYLNAFFWERKREGIVMLPYQYALSTNKLNNDRLRYFLIWRRHILRMIEFVDDYPPSKKGLQKFTSRVARMAAKQPLGWPEQVTTRFMSVYWKDLSSSLDRIKQSGCVACQSFLNGLKFNFDKEFEAAKQVFF